MRVRIAAGQDSSRLGWIEFEPARLASYSDAELIQFLSERSIESTLRSPTGITVIIPTRLSGPPARSPTDSTGHVVTLRAREDSSLSYLQSIIGELTRRRPLTALTEALTHSRDLVQLSWVEEALSRMRGPDVHSVLKQIAMIPRTDWAQYFALKYFAELGSLWALAILSCHYEQYAIYGLEWSQTITLFGRYHYYPAAGHLVRQVAVANMNVGFAALQTLLQLYPDGRSHFASPEEAAEYWTHYVQQREPREREQRLCSAHVTLREP